MKVFSFGLVSEGSYFRYHWIKDKNALQTIMTDKNSIIFLH